MLSTTQFVWHLMILDLSLYEEGKEAGENLQAFTFGCSALMR